MPDTRPIESEPQTQAQAARGQSNSVSSQPHALSPSSTLSVSSSNASSAPSSRRPHHKRFFSLSSLETSSTTILNTIRSRSPLPRSSTPVDSKERNNHSKASPPSGPALETRMPRSNSPTEMSPTSSIASPRPSFSHSRMPSDGTIGVTSTRSRSDKHKRYSGTLNHYGRHSNDWLFGGFSVRDTFRDGIDKLRGHSDRD